jgi:HEAT repeat protein
VAAGASRRLSWFWLAVLIVALLLVAGLAAVKWSIHSDVRDATAMAVQEFPGDGVQALIAVVESEDHPLPARNRAVWALGQTGDSRALPALERYYTGDACDHARRLCQHELKKAINLLRARAAR